MKAYLVLLLVIVLVSVPTSAQDAEWELTETWEITLRGQAATSFTIDYPAGWFARSDPMGRVTALNELEADHQRAFDDPFATQGNSLSVVFLRSGDLGELPPSSERTLEDLLALNSAAFGYGDLTGISEISFLTWPALQVRTVDGMGNHIVSIQGFLNKSKMDGFIVTLAAPSAEALDAFLPTWEAMLESIVIQEATVNMGDFGLYFECEGAGSPAVVLEPNIDGNPAMWSLSKIAEFTQVCVHNRGAHGDELLTFQDYAADTHDLLVMAGVEGPYVLVGPYVGGLFVLEYAVTYPDEAAGIVLVDGFHPDGWTRQLELSLEMGTLPEEEVETVWEHIRTDFASFGLDFDTSVAQVAAVESLGDIPLTVISPEIWGLPEDAISEEWHRIWIEEFQPDLAALSTNGTLIILEGVGHGDMHTRPEVVDAIQQMVEEVRAQEE